MTITPREEFPTVFDNTTCVRKGLCPVTKIRGQNEDPLESHSLYYEQHGSGTVKVVFIMGLNSSCFGWSKQVLHLTGVQQTWKDDYSVLVFDNRGVGNSSTPTGPYSTAGMAADVVALLDFVGWTDERCVNVVGISLGGMIALELSTLIPERVNSLVLAVTTPGGRPWQNFPPWTGVKSLARLIVTADFNAKAKIILPMLFPESWLQLQSDEDLNRTNYQVQMEDFLRRVAITRPQGLVGHISQMIAGLNHYVSPDRLSKISRSIPKVTIVTGDQDHLVDPRHSFDIKKYMPEAEIVQWQETGHAIQMQRSQQFNELMQRTFLEGSQRR
jgi:pimeloyl-ACP methyl ester carboxylesterase